MKGLSDDHKLQSREEKLIEACRNNKIYDITLLLKDGVNVNTTKSAPIQIAVNKQNKTMVKVLLAYGADYKIGLQSAEGTKTKTQKISEIKDILLACPDVRDICNKQQPKSKLNQAGFELLRVMNKFKLFDDHELLRNACKQNFVSVVEDLLLYGVNLQEMTPVHDKDIGALILSSAIHENKTEIVKILVANGAKCSESALNFLKKMKPTFSEVEQKMFDMIESVDYVNSIITNKSNVELSDLGVGAKELLEYKQILLKNRLIKACKENNLISIEAKDLPPMLGETLLKSSDQLTSKDRILGKIYTTIEDNKERDLLKNQIEKGLQKLITNKSLKTIIDIAAENDLDIIIHPDSANKDNGSYASRTNRILIYNYNAKTDNFLFTLIHEMTHFAMNTKFKNLSNPFPEEFNTSEKGEFLELAKFSIKKHPTLFEILERYEVDKHAIELPAFYFGGLAKDILRNDSVLKNIGLSELTVTMAGLMNELGCNITDISDVL